MKKFLGIFVFAISIIIAIYQAYDIIDMALHFDELIDTGVYTPSQFNDALVIHVSLFFAFGFIGSISYYLTKDSKP